MSNASTDAVGLQLRRGPTTSAELQARFGISQPGISRILAELQQRGEALAFGKARATRYAAPREVAGIGVFPLTQIDASGTARSFGSLRTIAPSAYLLTDRNGAHEVFEGLPWFIADMRPQGFLGRAFPRQYPDLALPPRVVDWTDDQALVALALRGPDCIGDLVIGDESLRRFIQNPPIAIPNHGVTSHYNRLAEAAIVGTPAGSSAGGEQPKFATTLRTGTGLRHVLVKFTDKSGGPAERRMRDLLICECLALQSLKDSGLGLVVPAHRLLHGKHRQFLEVERFDRTEGGRLGVASLMVIDGHFIGRMTIWSESAARLTDRRLISVEDARRIADLETFGRLIGNTDMHYGNLSFFRVDGPAPVPFRLAPVYDQLPMMYAPIAGEIVERDLRNSNLAPGAGGLSNFSRVVDLASEFWLTVSRHPLVSPDFRSIAASNAKIVRRLDRSSANAVSKT